MDLPLTAAPKTEHLRSARSSKYILPAILLAVVVALAVWFGWQATRGVQLPGTPASVEAVEEKWGIRITHIAVLADGGLIDFRFQVLDPDKASALFDLETRPLLYVEKTGQQVGSLYHPPHEHTSVAGQSHYFIYNNDRGAIQSGTPVSVVLGDLRLEHIIAQ